MWVASALEVIQQKHSLSKVFFERLANISCPLSYLEMK